VSRTTGVPVVRSPISQILSLHPRSEGVNHAIAPRRRKRRARTGRP
jgi:hypothetical protein